MVAREIWQLVWRKITSAFRSHAFVAILVFMATLAAFLYYAQNTRASVNKDSYTAFMQQRQVFSTAALSRLLLYESFLRGGAGLFNVSDSLSQSDWAQYFQPYDINNRFPDVRSIGFFRYITSDELDAFVAQTRARDWPSFTITPDYPRQFYAPLTYTAKFSKLAGKGVGYDAYTDSVRRAAMQTATTTDQPAMSGMVTPTGGSNSKPAFVIYLPVFKESMPTATAAQRQAALYGFVSAAVDVNMLIDELLKSNPNPNFAISITDMKQGSNGQPSAKANHATPFYQSNNFKRLISQSGHQASSVPFTLYQHKWTAEFVAGPGIISASDRQRPTTILVTGILASTALAGGVWLLIATREFRLNRQRQLEVQTAKDDLLSLASHQLRTPATVVKQYVGMLLQGYGGEISDKARGMLVSAYESNERQIQIINQLLYVARLDAGRISLHKEPVDIGELLGEVCDEQKLVVTERQQSLHYKPPHRTIQANADPHYLRMVFENLVGNAIKYTPAKGTITARVRRLGNEVLITVADTGIGIEEKRRGAIFDKFTRLENDVSGSVSGSGIGLYLVKQIIGLHNGQIEVISKPGSGSKFTVRLPLNPDESAAEK